MTTCRRNCSFPSLSPEPPFRFQPIGWCRGRSPPRSTPKTVVARGNRPINTMEWADGTYFSVSAVNNGNPRTQPNATTIGDTTSPRSGRFSRKASSNPSASTPAMAARRDWIDGLIDLKIATSFGCGHISVEFILGVLKDGSYRKYVDQLSVPFMLFMRLGRKAIPGLAAAVEPTPEVVRVFRPGRHDQKRKHACPRSYPKGYPKMQNGASE